MNDNDHNRKMIAPIVITILFLAYLIAYGLIAAKVTGFSPVMVIFAIPLIALGAGMVYVLRSRIREIRSGEEDDLDNY
ncbi:MAG: hypothetical protein Q4G47_05305 [Lachnospiraceae bacterium]|nr:hypothetical protein [Lachnospiraceae bacterium]